ncbi:MAG: alpha/beta fold hydrolase [Steroidobacteraceae bacterium]
MSTPPRAQSLRIAGPVGGLEALLEDPQHAPGAGFGVVCHPHPLHGGTMQNKVVHTLARALQEQGLPTLRFNYRGVGQSEGTYDEGRGERDDALAVIAWGRARWPNAPLVLAGFSFGALVALYAAPQAQPIRLIMVAPPVSHAPFPDVTPPTCPWLIVQGEADELVDYREVQAWAARFTPPPSLRLLAGVDHFFHGRLHELRDAVCSS